MYLSDPCWEIHCISAVVLYEMRQAAYPTGACACFQLFIFKRQMQGLRGAYISSLYAGGIAYGYSLFMGFSALRPKY